MAAEYWNHNAAFHDELVADAATTSALLPLLPRVGPSRAAAVGRGTLAALGRAVPDRCHGCRDIV